MGLIGSDGSEKGKHPLNPQIGFNGCIIFFRAQRKNLWDLTSTAEILRDPWNLCEAELLHFCAHQVVFLVAGDDVDLSVFNHLASLHFLSSGHIGDG